MLEIILQQNEPVISISLVEFCLRLYAYHDMNWRWGRPIGRETVYYTHWPLRIIYLLMAGRKPIKQSVIFDRETVNPGYSTSLFHISFLIPFIYCLISIIYCLLSKSVIYLLSKSVIYYLLSIIHYLLSIFIIYHLLSRLHCSQLLILSLDGCDATFVFLWLLKTWKLLLLVIS